MLDIRSKQNRLSIIGGKVCARCGTPLPEEYRQDLKQPRCEFCILKLREYKQRRKLSTPSIKEEL